MKLSKKKIRNYSYLFLLLSFSGNPFFTAREHWKIFFVFVSFLFLIRYYKKLLEISKSRYLYIFLIFFFLIFMLQFFFLGYVSLLGVLGFLLKITFGFIVIAIIGRNFKYIYFNLIYYLSLISLVGFFWNFLLGMDLPTNYINNSAFRSILVFTQNGLGLRNSGMFWEPGAFAIYILLSLLFLVGVIKEIIKKSKFRLLVILLALITTFSTTGYLLLFLLFLLTIVFEYGKKSFVLMVPIVILFGYTGYEVYNETEFLKDKIDGQFEEANEFEGEFNPSRFGAFMFDLYYIKKHPLIGNGIHEKTRYIDHPFLMGKKLGHGNGFSNFLASMGFLSLIFYSYFILKWKKQKSIIFLIFIFLLLQGENMMGYPLFLTIPFILLFDE